MAVEMLCGQDCTATGHMYTISKGHHSKSFNRNENLKTICTTTLDDYLFSEGFIQIRLMVVEMKRRTDRQMDRQTDGQCDHVMQPFSGWGDVSSDLSQ